MQKVVAHRPPLAYTLGMKENNSFQFVTLDKIIADAKAKREQEKKEHEKTMALLNSLKNKSIFAK